jgi:hypothetical protein
VRGSGPSGVLRIYFLSERDCGGKGRGNGRASCAKRSEREQGREMVYKKVWVLTKM